MKIQLKKQQMSTGILIFGVLVLLSVMGTIFILGIQNLLLEQTDNALQEISRQGAQSVSTQIQGRLDTLESLARMETIMGEQDLDAIHEAMSQEVTQKGFLRMGIADRNGDAYTTDGVTLNIGDRDYFQKALQGTSNISPNLEDKLENSIGIVVYATPVYRENQVTGVLFATDYTQNVIELITNITYMGGQNAFLFAADGTVLASGVDMFLPGPKDLYDLLKPENKEEALRRIQDNVSMDASDTGVFHYQGAVYRIAYTPVEASANWYLALASPETVIMNKANQIILRTGLVLVVGAVLILLALWYMMSLRGKYQREKSISRAAIRSSGLYLLTITREGRLLAADQALLDKLGVASMKKVCLQQLCRGDLQQIDEMLAMGAPFELELYPKGQKDPLFLQFHIIEGIEHRRQDSYEVMGLDITESRLQEQEIRRLAFHDSFTGLPNRFQMMHLIEKKFQSSRKKRKMAALVMVDLNKFQLINNTFGYRVGDAALKEVAGLLREMESSQAIAGRIGGDDFLLMLWDLKGQKELESILHTLSGKFALPFTVKDNTFTLSCNLGVTVYHGEEGEAPVNAEDLMLCCELATRKAKELQPNAFYIYNQELGQSVKREMEMENELNLSIQKQELELYLQPQYDIHQKQVVGFESLLRWNSAKYGQVSPMQFIPIAEKSGFIVDIGKFVMDQTFAFARKLSGRGICVSYNASAIELLQSDYVENVVERLQRYGLDAGSVAVEITESCLIESFSEVVEKLYALRLHGVRTYLDDFGTGYSSLNYLKNLPLDSVKIDKSFVDEIVTNPIEESIVKTIVQLSEKLHLKVIAEGVETAKQMDCLEKCGCGFIQGYYISRPVPVRQALDMVGKEETHD